MTYSKSDFETEQCHLSAQFYDCISNKIAVCWSESDQRYWDIYNTQQIAADKSSSDVERCFT